jgi:hypothetical protein
MAAPAEMAEMPLMVKRVTVETVALLEPAIAARLTAITVALAAPVALVETEGQQQPDLPAMVVLVVWALRAEPACRVQQPTALEAETVDKEDKAV